MLIYAIKRKNDDKVVYVGQTIRLFEIRKSAHLNQNRIDKNDTILIRAFKKYGVDYFKFDIIEDNIKTIEEMDEKEKYYIKLHQTYPPGSGAYNMTEGGHHPEFSEEYKQKLSKSQLKRYEDVNERIKTGIKSKEMYIKNPTLIEHKKQINHKRYEDVNERIKTGNAVKKSFDNNPEMKEKIGKATKQRYINHPELRLEQSWKSQNLECYIKGREKAHEAVRKRVRCVETGELFSSITNAALRMEVKAPSISKALRKQTKCKGVHWKYE